MNTKLIAVIAVAVVTVGALSKKNTATASTTTTGTMIDTVSDPSIIAPTVTAPASTSSTPTVANQNISATQAVVNTPYGVQVVQGQISTPIAVNDDLAAAAQAVDVAAAAGQGGGQAALDYGASLVEVRQDLESQGVSSYQADLLSAVAAGGTLVTIGHRLSIRYTRGSLNHE